MRDFVSLFTTYLPYFVLVLTLLVFVHEFGHYWVGRRFGIHAEVFSIGFGPSCSAGRTATARAGRSRRSRSAAT